MGTGLGGGVEWLHGSWVMGELPHTGRMRWRPGPTSKWPLKCPAWTSWMWHREDSLRHIRAFPMQLSSRREIWVWAALPPQPPSLSLISKPELHPQEPNGPDVDWAPRVVSHWATGGVLVLFTDGSLKRSLAAKRPL